MLVDVITLTTPVSRMSLPAGASGFFCSSDIAFRFLAGEPIVLGSGARVAKLSPGFRRMQAKVGNVITERAPLRIWMDMERY